MILKLSYIFMGHIVDLRRLSKADLYSSILKFLAINIHHMFVYIVSCEIKPSHHTLAQTSTVFP